MPILQPTISGLVFERTSEGARPIPAAWLGGDTGNGWAPSASTRSDATGRHILCGLSDVGSGFEIAAALGGYGLVDTRVDIRPTGSFDIELKRQ
jgi:hypothetical protein